MKPLDCVLVKAPGRYHGTAGVVERVDTDDDGKVARVVVDLDLDHNRRSYAPADLQVIKAH